MKPRNLAILLSAGLALAAAGCSSEQTPAAQSPSAQSTAGGTAPAAAAAPVTVTVACKPPKTDPRNRKTWEEDVAEFQKMYPHITLESTDNFPCFDPQTFPARLAGGQLEDMFFVPVTNTSQIISQKLAQDITPYVESVKTYKDVNKDVLSLFQADGATYGLPSAGYGTGLVYNRKLFEQAGLDPNTPPKTWAEVREAAKKITALGSGYIGFGEYAGGATGGWHFMQHLYARGGDVVKDGKAAFNSPEGKAVLQNLKDMRWTDKSMGSRLLIGWESLMQPMGAGKVGMMLGAPDVVPGVVNGFKGQFADYGVTVAPEAKHAQIGGGGFMFHPRATPDQIKAGLLWLEFQFLTPGKGQFNLERGKAIGNAVGVPDNTVFAGSPTGQAIEDLRKANATVPVDQYAGYNQGIATVTPKPEPPMAQEIYAVLDVAMSAVLSREDANVDELLAEAETKVNALLSKAGVAG
ncbi:ABC transporter substrate-binding protein [Nonomuraea soli]|uniref:Multiple sugar transport system substrate-binding protein n=1 Tax=Nonomuraea soli TaxID=1032476 RepID=A0A7W0CKT9_9ACTN|nr:extracellular solute-binding protein [Nonomuraea soli]MBA2892904.1 multiple sugar transport system substrate-binding protein [Nonomuraea soli]